MSLLSGAIQGAGAPFGPLGIVVGGALSAAAGTAIQGGSWSDIGRSALIGGASAYVGGKFAKGAGKIFNKVKINGIKFNPKSFVSKAVRGAVGGAAGGYGGGLAAGLIETGSLSQAHEYGKQGAVQGLKSGAIAGGTQAVVDARKGGYNFWSGKYTERSTTNYVKRNGYLPDNYITKDQAKGMGWNPKQGNLSEVAPGKSIGGDPYQNHDRSLPHVEGRNWYEADLNYQGGYRGSDRLLYSNDGWVYKWNHDKTFQLLKRGGN